MRYKKRIGTSTWVAAGVLALAVVGLAVFMMLRAGKPAQNRSVEVIGSETGVLLQEEKLTRECTYGCITFKVGEDWIKVEDKETTFLYPDGQSQYQILGTSELGRYTPEEFFTELVTLYMNEGAEIDVKGLKPLTSYVTADGIEGYVGRITFTKENTYHVEIDVLILPDKDYVVTIAGLCDKDRTLALDVRVITDTITINKETVAVKKAMVEGGVTSKTVNVNSCFYDANTGSLLDMTDTENFKIYVFADNKDGLYSGGTYEVYMGDDAVDKVDEMTFYGITREEVELMINRAQEGYALATGLSYQNPGDKLYSVDRNDFCAMVFNIEYIHDDSGNITENKKQPVLYVGFYVEELDMFDMTNCMTFSTYRWERQE
ncbi:hypothetical protein SAMN02910339_02389 [Lachnospiraceae bacterium YSD2013]|nr:hypothetical protein SAMN02910339_02389 [Lachnospiraceae bacterium YSD2013]